MNAKTCLVGFLKKKILVSAQENAKLSDRSMSAHFIKMTVNGRFSLIITQNSKIIPYFLCASTLFGAFGCETNKKNFWRGIDI